MTSRARLLAIPLLLVAAACVGRRAAPSAPAPTAWRDWAVASTEADRLIAAGRPDAADSTLADFMRRWPGTPQSEQGAWLRIVHQADQADDSASTAAVVTRIDSLLSTAPAATHRAELQVLRKTIVLTQQLRAERNALRAEREATAKQRSDEVEKLKAELDNVRAELDRVRKRVTRPRP